MKIIKLLIFFLTLAGFALIAAVESIASGSVQVRKETLAGVTPNATAEYNGIVLPLTWPPKNVSNLNKYTDTPGYLLDAGTGGYKPEVINIDTGRQLFVDNFLIDNTDLKITYHKPVEYEENPVFSAETDDEVKDTLPGAAPKSGGVWYDMDEKIYKMWYEAGWNNQMAYATGADGIHWTRPTLNNDGSNTIIGYQPTDSTTVWIDYDTKDPSQRYKMFVRASNLSTGSGTAGGILYVSENGTTWKKLGTSSAVNDRSTFFYNAFRKVWVFSIRDNANVAWKGLTASQRVRFYHESSDFAAAFTFDIMNNQRVFWQKTDSLDARDTSVSNEVPQLYNFDAIAYESVMIGWFQIWYGPENSVCASTGQPKITELQASYSRDGFYFDRPDRTAFIAASRTEGTWNYGYVQSVGGSVIVHDDELWIYHIGYSGDYTDSNGLAYSGMHVGGALGLAILRRDGFASAGGTGSLTTEKLTVTKDVKYLFVNADCTSLKAEILDMDGNVVEGYTSDDCLAFSGDNCSAMIGWKSAEDLSFLKGKGFRIKFLLENGELYSFWLSDDKYGTSDGKYGAGYTGNIEELSLVAETTASVETTSVPADDSTVEKKSDKNGCGSTIIPTLLMVIAAIYLIVMKKKPRRQYEKQYNARSLSYYDNSIQQRR